MFTETLLLFQTFIDKNPFSIAGIDKFFNNFKQTLQTDPSSTNCRLYVAIILTLHKLHKDGIRIHEICYKHTSPPFQVTLVVNKGRHWIKVVTQSKQHERLSEQLDLMLQTCTKVSLYWFDCQQQQDLHSGGLGQGKVETIHCDFNLPTSIHETPYSAMINLDVTTLLALISETTHTGGSHLPAELLFSNKTFSLQYEDEKVNPMLPFLRSILRRRKLVTTERAFQIFSNIIDTIGGPNEKIRAKSLFDLESKTTWHVDIIPIKPSKRFMQLNTDKIKQDQIDIFGTGDALNIVTSTSNSAITRQLRHKGMRWIDILIHSPRSLSENKQ